MKTVPLFLFIGLVALGGCKPPEPAEPESKTPKGPAKMVIVSPDFPAGGDIPAEFTADGKNVSPGLNWTDVPEKAKALALIVEDPDAPGDKPFIHWLVANLPTKPNLLPENVPNSPASLGENRGIQGKNGSGSIGYFGPKPPSGTHRYHFEIYALDAPLTLPDGFTKEDLDKAMKDHVLGQGEFVGLYTKK